MKLVVFPACVTVASAFSTMNGQHLSSGLYATVVKSSVIPPVTDSSSIESIYDSNVQTTYG